MSDIDIALVSYRTEVEVSRIESDLRDLTVNPYKLNVFDNFGHQRNLSMLWNDLVLQGTGEYVAFFNPDIVICPEWDRMLIQELERQPSLGAVLPSPVGSGRPVWSMGRRVAAALSDPPTREEMQAVKEAMAGNEGVYVYVETDPCAFFAVVMRRSLFESLKGFDERFTLYGQDHEMQDRIRLQGLQTGAVVRVPFWHGGSLSTQRAKRHGEVLLQEEYVRFGQILGPLRKGILRRWHLLSDEERAAVRTDTRYTMIAKP